MPYEKEIARSSNLDVVVPCYNGVGYLGAAIASVRQQTVQPSSIVVVDDGSTDGSAELARANGCTVVSTGYNAGPSRARNIGVSACSADLVAFLDADDTWEPWHIANVLELAAAVPDALVLFAAIEPCGAAKAYEKPRVSPKLPIDLSQRLLGENFIAQSAAVVHRSAFLDVGGYDESMRFSEDYDLWLRLSRRVLFAYTGSASVRYRVHDSQSSMRRACLIEGAWHARLKHHAWLQSRTESAPRAVVEACLVDALNRDLRDAWYFKERKYFDRTLAVGRTVPFLRETVRDWEARRRWLWYPSVVGRTAADKLPKRIRGVLKRVLAP